MTPEDEAIRSRLHADAATAVPAAPALVVFGQLAPRLRRARRMRRIAVGTTGVVLMGAAAAAIQFSLDARATTIRTSVENQGGLAIDELEAGHTRAGAGQVDEGDSSSEGSRSTPRDVSVATTSTAEPTTSTPASAPAIPGIGVPATSTPGSTTVAAPVPPAPIVDPTIATSTSVVAGTQPPNPSIGTHRIDSACGTIVVEIDDDRVDLVDVIANAGFDVDVKSDGPEGVEVGLRDGDDECELKARLVGGQLVTTVEGPEAGEEVEGSETGEEHEPGEDSDDEDSGEGSDEDSVIGSEDESR